ncbi:putative halogenase [Exidia glandulosa HHB12029]|uniref:Putative halogenase n=1 Tax=Exidia glandulosa HHB12029 TaxID=1314781 RepID=A0A165NN19_EXIGL|nr:putative halogenase [Exidia glandulosa HHB12029]
MDGTPLATHTQILVIGGGPAGSYAATALAREGLEVTLLERAHFPRYHIGESLLPSCKPFLKFIDALDKVASHGFMPKPGAAVKLNQHKREGYTDFIQLNPDNASWNVVRSDFDEILLRHAQACGVKVFEGVRVDALNFAECDGEERMPISASWASEAAKGTLSFDYLVDASGRGGIMSTKYLKNRKLNNALKNTAHWAYWTGAGMYMPGTDRHNAPWFEALTDESGWAWFIPLHNGTVSVGVVVSEESARSEKTRLRRLQSEQDDILTQFYMSRLDLAPGLKRLLGSAKLASPVKHEGDYSYSAKQYSGSNWRLIGDASAFIDPFFSSGVHLAFTGGLSAACTIAAAIRGGCSKEEASAYHNFKVSTSYTRFLLVVLGIYKHIRAQDSVHLSDVDEDNFDRAFHIIRPVIQGAADADPHLTKTELEATMDFCKNVFAPTTPETYRAVADRLEDKRLMDADGPLLSTQQVCELTREDEEARHVLLEINARKAVHVEYDPTHNFQTEVLGGFYARMEQGRLGLVKA